MPEIVPVPSPTVTQPPVRLALPPRPLAQLRPEAPGGQPQQAEAAPAPPAAAPSVDPVPEEPQKAGTETDGAPKQAMGKSSSGSSGSSEAAQGGQAQPTAASPSAVPRAGPGPTAETNGEPSVSARERPAPTVIERIVGVVPLPLKVALGVLAALLVVAVAGVWRTRRRLAQAERRAATDALTGLPNRRHAEEVIERLLAAARRNDRPLAVVLLDLDHFKEVNDRFGHAFGDEALRATAVTTRRLLRASDHVARFGGEEFLLLLPETPAIDAAEVAEKVRIRIAGLDLAGFDGELTASFGVAAYPEHGRSSGDLIRAADAALYRAKESGRNRVESSAEPDLAPVGGA